MEVSGWRTSATMHAVTCAPELRGTLAEREGLGGDSTVSQRGTSLRMTIGVLGGEKS
jgi:hypothetical protein